MHALLDNNILGLWYLKLAIKIDQSVETINARWQSHQSNILTAIPVVGRPIEDPGTFPR